MSVGGPRSLASGSSDVHPEHHNAPVRRVCQNPCYHTHHAFLLYTKKTYRDAYSITMCTLSRCIRHEPESSGERNQERKQERSLVTSWH